MKPNANKLRLINNLSSNLEVFEPMNPNLLTWYTCGPTVYDHSHIGHARNYICTDALRRTLINW
jgi:cysteinyl-tRNA synthetase